MFEHLLTKHCWLMQRMYQNVTKASIPFLCIVLLNLVNVCEIFIFLLNIRRSKENVFESTQNLRKLHLTKVVHSLA